MSLEERVSLLGTVLRGVIIAQEILCRVIASNHTFTAGGHNAIRNEMYDVSKKLDELKKVLPL